MFESPISCGVSFPHFNVQLQERLYLSFLTVCLCSATSGTISEFTEWIQPAYSPLGNIEICQRTMSPRRRFYIGTTETHPSLQAPTKQTVRNGEQKTAPYERVTRR